MLLRFFYLMLIVAVLPACTRVVPGNSGSIQSYPYAVVEPEWIRKGEPLIFESKEWVPVDNVETLMDSEVFQVGEYRGAQIFVEKIDVRPYDRLYTKFDRNKFRFFELKDND